MGGGKPLELKTERFLGKNWFQAKWKRICEMLYLLHKSFCELIAKIGIFIFPSGEPATPNFPQLLHETLAGPAPAPAVSAVTGKLLAQVFSGLFCFFSWRKEWFCKLVILFLNAPVRRALHQPNPPINGAVLPTVSLWTGLWEWRRLLLNLRHEGMHLTEVRIWRETWKNWDLKNIFQELSK